MPRIRTITAALLATPPELGLASSSVLSADVSIINWQLCADRRLQDGGFDDALERTQAFWREWSDRCPEVGACTEALKRSLITLKALTYAPTGGIVAAATMSLPERLGGVRNWDYRYCCAAGRHVHVLGLHAPRILR